MPTLKTFGGPVRTPGSCGCDEMAAGPSVTQGPSLLPTKDVCGPGPAAEEQLPGNEPVEDAAYRCSLGVSLQPALDRVRRIPHVLGLRPYRVFLVWQQRNRDRVWETVAEMEVVPVVLRALDSVDLSLSQVGLQPDGGISLSEISPSQVTEDDLRGFFDGKLWGADTIDKQFFYEVRLHERCVSDPDNGRILPAGTKRRRFIIGSEPYFDGSSHQFRVGLVDQEIARDRDGGDATIDRGQNVRNLPPAPRIVP